MHGGEPAGLFRDSRSDGGNTFMQNKDLVLVVDDERDMRQMVCRALQREGYRTLEAGDGAEMRQILGARDVDLVVLDIMLPDTDGFTLAREIRASSTMPIIMLTGRDDVVDKVAGLEIGADDYLTKPFHPRELTARVRSILRRSSSPDPVASNATGKETKTAHFDGWALDFGTFRLVTPKGDDVGLTSYEFQVLAVLVQNSKRVLSRDQILDLVADREWNPYDRSIDVLIGKIRKKLEDDPAQSEYIKTVRGIGYMFVADVSLSGA